MKQLVWLMLSWMLIGMSCKAQPSYPTRTDTLVFGLDTLRIETVFYSPADTVWLNVHENEGTSVRAADSVLRENPVGRRLRLMQFGERYLKFRTDTGFALVDPNRIFTDHGLTANMILMMGPAYPDSLFRIIVTIRDSLITRIGNASLIISLHNNTDENYKVSDYDTTRGYQTVRYTGSDTDDFVLTTSPDWFNRLKGKPFHLALETLDAVDDGSFSVFANRRGIAYLNVEAQHGHVEEQMKMIREIIRLMKAVPDNR